MVFLSNFSYQDATNAADNVFAIGGSVYSLAKNSTVSCYSGTFDQITSNSLHVTGDVVVGGEDAENACFYGLFDSFTAGFTLKDNRLHIDGSLSAEGSEEAFVYGIANDAFTGDCENNGIYVKGDVSAKGADARAYGGTGRILPDTVMKDSVIRIDGKLSAEGTQSAAAGLAGEIAGEVTGNAVYIGEGISGGIFSLLAVSAEADADIADNTYIGPPGKDKSGIYHYKKFISEVAEGADIKTNYYTSVLEGQRLVNELKYDAEFALVKTVGERYRMHEGAGADELYMSAENAENIRFTGVDGALLSLDEGKLSYTGKADVILAKAHAGESGAAFDLPGIDIKKSIVISGKIYLDINENGAFDEQVDLPIQGSVELWYDEFLTEAQTEADGRYTMNLPLYSADLLEYAMEMEAFENLIFSPASDINAQGIKFEVDYQTEAYEKNAVFRYPEGQITIIYKTNGGEGEDYTAKAAESGSHTVLDIQDVGFSRENHIFIGWNTDKDALTGEPEYRPGETVTLEENLILYAIWYDDGGAHHPGVTVIYKANGGVGEDVIDELKDGEEYEIRSIDSTSFTRSGYTFAGWSTNENGAADSTYAPGSKVEIEESIVLYAIWQSPRGSGTTSSAAGYTLTYHGAENDTLTERYNAGAEVTAKDGGIFEVPQGMLFAGWSLTANGEVNYKAGDIFKMPSSNLHLYAVYIELSSGHSAGGLLNREDHFAYIIGYPDGTVRPEANITRAEAITIFFRLMTDEARNTYWSRSNPFADVKQDDWYNNAYSVLYRAEVIEGYNGFGAPNAPITRAEAAAIAVRLGGYEAEADTAFRDIANHWAYDEIGRAAANGWITGYTDGTFRPDNPITRAEMMALVNRMLERHIEADTQMTGDAVLWPDNDNSKWFYYEVQEASNSHYYEWENDRERWTSLRPAPDWAELENAKE